MTTAERSSEPLTGSNVPELTVGELSGALKRTIEDRFGFVRVRGEISNYRGPHASGHAYFCLKDDAARIDAVIWKTAFLRMKTKPQEGLEVVATGRITTFPGKSTYQIVIEAMEPAGLGALMALLEARRRALAAEGLFDESRKRPIPFLPRTIGVVTSPTGAVIRDILHRVEDRFPCHVLLWPVRVQGDTAAAEIAAAIEGFSRLSLPGVPKPDLLLVARGGGSLEDLWAFNEETVVRAAAASSIPLISAVGHETDWTLIDHVADLRAPTPTGAAEKALPVRSELLRHQADLARRHAAALLRSIERHRTDLRALTRILPPIESLAAQPRQRLDALDGRLLGALARAHDQRQLALGRAAHRLAEQAPRMRLAHMQHAVAALEQRLRFCLDRAAERRGQRIDQTRQRLETVSRGLRREIKRQSDSVARAEERLDRSFALRLAAHRQTIARFGQLLDSLGYRKVLSRGFALVRGPDGHPVRQVNDTSAGAVLDIELADGHIDAIVGGARRAPRPARPTQKDEKRGQGSLF